MTISLSAHVPDAETIESLAAQQLRIGQEHYASGAIEPAIAAYRCGLVILGKDPSGSASVDVVSSLHSSLGNACMLAGDLEGAAENYRAALRVAPHLAACWCNLASVHMKWERPQDAVALYVQALSLDPGHWPSRTNLVKALMAARQYLFAKPLLMELIGERPQDGELHHLLGKVLFELDELDAALECFREAARLNPDDADNIYWIGGIRQRMGETEAAALAYAEAARLQPLIRRPAARFPAEFRVLALFAPFAGNLPTAYLFKDAPYDTDTLAVFESGEYDEVVRSQDTDVVVNLISDADQAGSLLPLAGDIAGRFGRPVINAPEKIRGTTRDAVAAMLEGIPGCRVARVWRQKAGAGLSAEILQAALSFSSTVLVRPVGTHGGDDFEKIDGDAALAVHLTEVPRNDRYFIEYIDYRSADGYFRKYRFIFVDDEILPYHLAIASDWKVHHDSSDMSDHRWMQREEEAFLGNPGAVFHAGHYRIMREIRRRIGLDYFGIDCALDRAGNLVVFEANASMLVHEQNDEFPYKAPFVHRIRSAFDQMLRRFAAIDAMPETVSG